MENNKSENHYTNAVNHFEKLVNYIEDLIDPNTGEFRFNERAIEILKYNVTFLKLQPQYQGQLPDVPQSKTT